MNGLMLGVLPGFLGPRVVFLDIDSFSVVDVSNDLLPEAGYLSVELNGGMNALLLLLGELFHVLLG